MTSFVEHLPLLVVVFSLLSAITILIAGWINRKAACYVSWATLLGQFILSLLILKHVLTVGPIRYRLGGW
ncbi:MAG: monovalent cation/H+ antiporter subunit D family protein, partial [Thermodesulfobacteriota bacterium]